jgi:hypothetical protein
VRERREERSEDVTYAGAVEGGERDRVSAREHSQETERERERKRCVLLLCTSPNAARESVSDASCLLVARGVHRYCQRVLTDAAYVCVDRYCLQCSGSGCFSSSS